VIKLKKKGLKRENYATHSIVRDVETGKIVDYIDRDRSRAMKRVHRKKRTGFSI